MTERVHYEDDLPGGSHWSIQLRKGTFLRLVDRTGGANVGMLFYNPLNNLERYNAPDTLKCQHTFKLTRGHCLYSDMGRIFCSIVEDTVGWHDTVGGNATAAMVRNKWGERTYQHHRNDWYLNGHDSFLVELAKYGMNERDLAANLNLFSKVAVDGSGNLLFDPGNSQSGNSVTLRFEMDTLVVLHTCPHPMNPATEYPRRTVAYQIGQADDVTANDYCRGFRPENERGFRNTDLYNIGRDC